MAWRIIIGTLLERTVLRSLIRPLAVSFSRSLVRSFVRSFRSSPRLARVSEARERIFGKC